MIRVYLSQGPFGDFLRVFIVDQQDYGKRLLRMESGGMHRWEDVGSEGAAVAEVEPTFDLPWDTGRALLEALVQHYQGAEDTRQLRKDYDAERKRVDEQSRVISDIAKMLAERAR